MEQISQQLATHVEQARTRLAQAEATWAKAMDLRGRVGQRIADLQQERQQIIQARAAGQQDEDQAARLVVIEADLEGLQPILQKAEAEATRLDPAHARQNVALSEEQWHRHQIEVRFQAMATRVKEIEGVFLAAVVELHNLGKQLGAGHQHLSQNWRPSTDLGRLIHHGVLPGSGQ